jgi:hypothetical protein
MLEFQNLLQKRNGLKNMLAGYDAAAEELGNTEQSSAILC